MRAVPILKLVGSLSISHTDRSRGGHLGSCIKDAIVTHVFEISLYMLSASPCSALVLAAALNVSRFPPVGPPRTTTDVYVLEAQRGNVTVVSLRRRRSPQMPRRHHCEVPAYTGRSACCVSCLRSSSQQSSQRSRTVTRHSARPGANAGGSLMMAVRDDPVSATLI